MVEQIITFEGGLSTKMAPHLIARNEGIICENVDIEKGSLYPLAELIFIENVAGQHIKIQDDIIIASQAGTDDRFYDTYGGRLYWSNANYVASDYGLMRYNDTDVGINAEAPDAPDAAPTYTEVNAGVLSSEYIYCYTFVDTDGIGIFAIIVSVFGFITPILGVTVSVT